MERLIDAEALLDVVFEMLRSELDVERWIGMRKIVNVIEAAPTVEPDGWISVKEKIPCTADNVLIRAPSPFNDDSGFIDIGNYRRDKKYPQQNGWYLGNNKMGSFVSHWQPLPQPPKTR